MLGLPDTPAMQDFQRAVYNLEAHHGWLDVDLIHNCFLMGEEVGELFKAIRKHQKFYETGGDDAEMVADVAEEIVDVLNYLLAIANRLDIDVETAFREKNAKNLERTWS
jgi:NTP pyrophosphatase (non-canonical NTP hydrolase)